MGIADDSHMESNETKGHDAKAKGGNSNHKRSVKQKSPDVAINQAT